MSFCLLTGVVVPSQDTQQRPSIITLVPGLGRVAPEAKHTSHPDFRRGFGCVDDGETVPSLSTSFKSNPPGTPLVPSSSSSSSVPSPAPLPSTVNHITTRANKEFTWRPPSDSPPVSRQPHQTEHFLTKVQETQTTEEQREARRGHTSTPQLLHAPAEEQNYLPKKLRACKKFQSRRNDACIQWQHQHQHLHRQ